MKFTFELWIETKLMSMIHTVSFLLLFFVVFLCRSILIIYQLIINPHNNQLPVGLIAQMVEHCTGIAEVSVSVPNQAFLTTTT